MSTTDWTRQPVTILGLSKSGIAAAQYLARRGGHCFLSETVPASPANREARESLEALGVSVEMGGHSARCFDHSDLVIVSPGIPPSAQIMKELALSGKTIISEVELAFRETRVPWIGVTGTNGKTTTTTLISEILKAHGQNAPACGNIGLPVISLAAEPVQTFVVELSSFQLQFSPTLKAKIALLLNFRPDHLDWHGSEEAYRRAKCRLFEGEQTPDWAILNADDPVCQALGAHVTCPILWFSRDITHVAHVPNAITLDAAGQVLIRLDPQPETALLNSHHVRLVGRHNQENILAAAGACHLMGVPAETIARASEAFPGVPHRLEPIAEVDRVLYYNDSKATNPDAAISALQAFEPRKVVLIAGGRDKKTSLVAWIDAVKAHAAHVVLLGEAADRFALELTAAGYSRLTTTASLEEAVDQAAHLATPDTPVLFSPACASFDMFKNFEERGDAFKAAVMARMPMTPVG